MKSVDPSVRIAERSNRSASDMHLKEQRRILKESEQHHASLLKQNNAEYAQLMQTEVYDKPLEAVFQAYPITPIREMQLAKIDKGRVKIEVRLDLSGAVERVKILESSHTMFHDTTIKTAMTWKFKPMLQGKAPVFHLQEFVVDFSIEE